MINSYKNPKMCLACPKICPRHTAHAPLQQFNFWYPFQPYQEKAYFLNSFLRRKRLRKEIFLTDRLQVNHLPRSYSGILFWLGAIFLRVPLTCRAAKWIKILMNCHVLLQMQNVHHYQTHHNLNLNPFIRHVSRLTNKAGRTPEKCKQRGPLRSPCVLRQFCLGYSVHQKIFRLSNYSLFNFPMVRAASL